jgi:hypothetical protein
VGTARARRDAGHRAADGLRVLPPGRALLVAQGGGHRRRGRGSCGRRYGRGGAQRQRHGAAGGRDGQRAAAHQQALRRDVPRAGEAHAEDLRPAGDRRVGLRDGRGADAHGHHSLRPGPRLLGRPALGRRRRLLCGPALQRPELQVRGAAYAPAWRYFGSQRIASRQAAFFRRAAARRHMHAPSAPPAV